MVMVNLAANKRYIAVFDEALMALDAFEASTCERESHNPHKHYTVIQVELDPEGGIVSFVPTPGNHQKEVEVIYKEATEHGVVCYLPENLTDRIHESSDEFWVTLKRESTGNAAPKLFVDVHGPKNFQRAVGSHDDTPIGYAAARRLMLTTAARLNITYDDVVGGDILEGK